MSDIEAELNGARNVLLLAPTMSERSNETCSELLTTVDPAEANVLLITLTDTPDERLGIWREYVGDVLPAESAIISVGETTRSSSHSTRSSRLPASVSTVSNPENLTRLGIEINEHLEQWHGNGYTTVVCFHSLSALLQFADVQRVFRFLHVLTGRITDTGGIAHYHMDPGVHDDKTVHTLLPLFDATIDVEEEDATVQA